MGATVAWSYASLDDLDAIAEYIGRDSPVHAQRVLESLLELGEMIGEHPMAGRRVPELENERVRERFLYSYRLIYEVGDGRIDVLAVIHGRRLLESIGRLD